MMSSSPDLRRSLVYVEWLRRRAWGVLALFIAAAVAAGFLVSRLELRAQFSELLPEGDPAVVELDRLLKRVGASTTFIILLKSDQPEKNRQFAKTLVDTLRQEPPETWRSISYETSEERAFFEKYALLYADLQDLTLLYETLKEEIDRRKTGAISFDDEEFSVEDLLARLEAKYRQKYQDQLLFPSGYFEGGENLGTLAVVIRPATEALGGAETEAMYDLIDGAVQKTREALGDAAEGVKAIYTGDIPATLQEKEALKEDLGVAAIACVTLVFLVIGLYFRQLRLVFLAPLPALVGTLFAFAVAYIFIGYLNSNTAFLGSIILGNGINYAIMALARYREERLAGQDLQQALARAITFTWKPTLATSFAASIAYGSLMVTQFRGFSQFGLVGCVGMILCWLVTFSLTPTLILILEKFKPSRFQTRAEGIEAPSFIGLTLGRLARVVVGRPLPFLAVSLTLFGLSFYPLIPLLKDPFEYDFTKLRNERALVEGPASYQKEVIELFGRSLTPAIVVTDSPEEAEAARLGIIAKDEFLSQRPGGRKCVGKMETLSDLLPPHQEAKFVVLERIQKLLSQDALELASVEQKEQIEKARAQIEKLFNQGKPDYLTLDKLPESIAAAHTELDGTRGRLLHVQRDESVGPWEGRGLMCFAHATSDIPLSGPDDTGNPKIVSATGIAAVFTDMIGAIIRDGPRATVVALALVVILIFATFRSFSAWVTIMLSLLTGVVLMLGIAALLGMRLNFLNFVAIPITFGIASEYGMNLYDRGIKDGYKKLPEAITNTGGAVALCSLTTIIGYGTLILSDNQALQSFGQLAGLGEVTTLLTAMIIIPAALALSGRRAMGNGQ